MILSLEFMKICFFIDFFLPHYYGGGQVRLCELAKRLQKKGHEITIVTMRHPNVSEQETVEGLNIQHIGPVIQHPPTRTIKDLFVFFFAVRTWLKQHRYDVVCAEGMSLFPCYFFAGSTPVVATVHDVSTEAKDQWFGLGTISRLGEKVALKLPYARIITVSNAVKQELISRYHVSQQRIAVIPNAVDAKKLQTVRALPLQKKTLVFIGRFIPHKHVDDLLQAFAKVHKINRSVQLLLFGSGPEEENLRRLTKELLLEKGVQFYINAPTKEVMGRLKCSAALVLPSTREGFGITLAEAGVLGIPVIAYDIPAVREVVLNNKTGILVPVRDVEELANAVLFMLKYPKKAQLLGRAAQSYICSSFNWDVSAQLFDELLKNLE